MLIGIGLGFVVGILPGLGGPTTLALMLPFVFKMNPVEAFAFLLGMAAVTNTTGDITSILFGIPGEPTTASTIVDGHPMAKRGEAGRALGAAITSSLFGAVFGAVVLGLAIPVVRPLVLTFGSPEFFMLALLGITFVASLSGEAVLKGLIAGCLGLWFATVGMAPVSAVQRYTFGQLFLWDGIGLVPVTIGFFAIPEVIDLAVRGSSIAPVQVGRLGGVWQGVRDAMVHWALVLRCSAIGTFIAIIPGMGAATTQWLAYAHAVQSSRHRERFGHGAVEGVLGPGAANNSTLGGSLVTTVAFGVPASVTMAILMGAFLIQGLVPGPSMLMPAPKGHLAVTFSMVWTIVVSNVITSAICFLFLRQLARVTQIRGTLLIPFILVLIAVGAFAEKNVFEDVLIVLLFGALGWVMSRAGWPRPPLLLGLVLGPLAENKLFLSTGNYGMAWIGRPGVLVLLVLILAGLFVPIVSRYRQRARAAAVDRSDAPHAERRTLRLDGAVLFTALLVLVFAAALWESLGFGLRAGLFPWAVCAPGLVLGLVQLARDLTGRRDASAETADDPADGSVPAEVVKRRTVGICLWIVGFWTAIWLLGFSLATLCMTFLYLRLGARERWLMCAVLTVAAAAFVYGLFERALGVPFPAGRLFAWLGVG
jgi:putative tricarboxylic transport membrane protein